MINTYLSTVSFITDTYSEVEKMKKEFQQKADKEAELYWDASKYPRKKKKKIRKKCLINFRYYTILATPIKYY